MVDCRLKRNKGLASCKKRRNNPKKLKCWRKGKKDVYVSKKEVVEIAKVNFSWEKPAHNVVVYDRTKHSLESSFGKVKKVEHLGSKKQATKRAKAYMKKHDVC